MSSRGKSAGEIGVSAAEASFDMAIWNGYPVAMQERSVAEAKNNLSKLIQEVESGEEIVITRRGNPVAMLTQPPAKRHKPRFGSLAGKIKLTEGWDAPMSEKELKEFLGE